MATIEERATQHFRRIYQGEKDNIYLSLVEIATEQDRIARQEEREKACKLYRNELMQVVHLMNISRKDSGKLIDIDGSINEFRKAMEGGNNGKETSK